MKKIFCFICTFIIMINVNAKQIVAVGGSTTDSNDVYVSKTISAGDRENYFDITLTVKAPTSIKEVLVEKDISVVLVMDVSNTMVTTNIDGTMHSSYPDKITRYDAAISASKSFIEEFTSFSLNTSVVRSIGYVAFNSDAKEIFNLTECKDNNTKDVLINTMKNNTSSIVNADNYDNSHKRFTNIEAGLKMAYDMLKKSSSNNKYIIFLSDGFPTTYIKDNYNGYDTYTPYSTSSSEGNFYDSIHKLPCSIGVSYSNRAALKAQDMAKKIKDNNITIYSVGAGLDGQKPISELLKSNTKSYSIVDTESSDYIIGNSIQSFKSWLKNSIGSGYYYDTNNISNIKEAYNKIFENIKKRDKSIIESDLVIDPIPDYIEFLDFYNSKNVVDFNNNEIKWNLKESSYELKDNIYVYKLKYKVRLKNELKDFSEDNIYETNGKTYLDYKINRNNVIDGASIDFKIPKVKGFLTNIIFTKVSSKDNKPLKGVKFKLVHDDCDIPIEEYYSISDENGKVEFLNIPSGHTYILEEVSTLDNYKLDNTKYNIEVSYGKTKISPNIKNNIIKNDPVEERIEVNPNTLDNINTWMLLFFISLFNIVIVFKYKYR